MNSTYSILYDRPVYKTMMAFSSQRKASSEVIDFIDKHLQFDDPILDLTPVLEALP